MQLGKNKVFLIQFREILVLINRDVLHTINLVDIEKEEERNKNRKVTEEKKRKKKNISWFLPIYDATFVGKLANSKSNGK